MRSQRDGIAQAESLLMNDVVNVDAVRIVGLA